MNEVKSPPMRCGRCGGLFNAGDHQCPRRVGDILKMLANSRFIVAEPPSLFDFEAERAEWELRSDGSTFVSCGGMVLATFHPPKEKATHCKVHLVFDDQEGRTWDVRKRKGRESPHTSRPAAKLKLVMSG